MGIEVPKTTEGINLSQKKYIRDLLKQVHMDKAYTLPTPMDSNLSLSSK